MHEPRAHSADREKTLPKMGNVLVLVRRYAAVIMCPLKRFGQSNYSVEAMQFYSFIVFCLRLYFFLAMKF